MDDHAAADLEELARRDDGLSTGPRGELEGQVATCARRGGRSFLAVYPEEEERRREAVAEAEAETGMAPTVAAQVARARARGILRRRGVATPSATRDSRGERAREGAARLS